MSRYIDVEAFRKEMDNHAPFDKYTQDHDPILNCAKSRIIKMLATFPSADVVEVRHGHWEQEQPQYRLYKCSVCNKVCFVERWGDKTVLYDYCPNCGARMRMTKEQYESHVGDIYEDGDDGE